MTSRLDRLLNIATLAICVAIVVLLFKLPRPPRPPEPYEKGDTLSAVDASAYGGTPETLLIVLRDGCQYCADSMPFYRRLLASRSPQEGARLRVVAVVLMQRDAQKAHDYVRQNELPVDAVVALTPEQHAKFKVVGTPTMILVNRKGVVSEQWIGKLDQATEDAVVERLFPVARKSD